MSSITLKELDLVMDRTLERIKGRYEKQFPTLPTAAKLTMEEIRLELVGRQLDQLNGDINHVKSTSKK